MQQQSCFVTAAAIGQATWLTQGQALCLTCVLFACISSLAAFRHSAAVYAHSCAQRPS